MDFYEEFKNIKLDVIFCLDEFDNSALRLDNIHTDGSSVVNCMPYENIEQHVKHFHIEDLTHQVLESRDSLIDSDQESLASIGQWDKIIFVEHFPKISHQH